MPVKPEAASTNLSRSNVSLTDRTRPIYYISPRHSMSGRKQDSATALLPLPLAVFHMLLALSEGERHGYALKREIFQRTAGKLNLGSGALYGSMNPTSAQIRTWTTSGADTTALRRSDVAQRRPRRRGCESWCGSPNAI
jgi:hypothetical protein